MAILLYGYCLGVRSSRRIARALEEDAGFRVVAANRQPDFRTICRFRAEREEAFEELFVEVLRLCHEAGLVKLGVVLLMGRRWQPTRPWPPTGATRPLKKKCGACWQRPRQWMLKRMPIMVLTGEGMSYRTGS